MQLLKTLRRKKCVPVNIVNSFITGITGGTADKKILSGRVQGRALLTARFWNFFSK